MNLMSTMALLLCCDYCMVPTKDITMIEKGMYGNDQQQQYVIPLETDAQIDPC